MVQGEIEQSGYMTFRERCRQPVQVFAMAGLAIAAYSGYQAADEHFSRSGEGTLIPAIKPSFGSIDNQFNIGSWNAQGKIRFRIKQLQEFNEDDNLDALALQEVTVEDAQLIRKQFKNWNVYSMLADTKQEALSGGYGNILMTRQKPTNAETESLKGESFKVTVAKTTAAGVIDLSHLDTRFSRSRQSMRENRAIGGFTIQAFNGVKPVDIRVITTHLSNHKDTNPQHAEQAFKFIDKNTSDDYATIVCGDFNMVPKAAVKLFTDHQYRVDYTAATTYDKTGRSPGKTIDYCAYHGIDMIGLSDTQRRLQYRTDHYAIVSKWKLEPPTQ